MVHLRALGVLSALLAVTSAKTLPPNKENKFHLRPFHIDLSHDVPRMIELVRNSHLSEKPEYPGVGSSMGIDLDVLKSLRKQWLSDFHWKKEQDNLNKRYPLLLNHGWPGSILEFIPIIEPRTEKAKTSTGKPVSFDIIIPSLPGYAFSSPPPEGWTVEDTARVFNTLMTDVLGYKKFAVHGTDLGAPIAYHLYDAFNATTRAAHFVFVPFYPLTPNELIASNITLSPEEEFVEQNFVRWSTTEGGYFQEHSYEPNTVGLALYDNPLGQLAWIGDKFLNWSDPGAGASPSVLDHHEILRSVTLYYLTKSFVSSVYMYAQNLNGFKTEYTKARTDAPLFFSTFKYNIAFWPKELLATVGNLVQYRFHDFGGHFPGVDNPPALIEDLREIGRVRSGRILIDTSRVCVFRYPAI